MILKDIDLLVFHISRFKRSGANLLRSELLPLTISNALRTKFYQELWSNNNLKQVSLQTLWTLPFITKNDIRRAGESAQIREELVCDEVFTMGTTGTPLVTIKGDWEQRFITTFFEAHANIDSCSKRRRVLKFNDPYHGYHIKVPSGFHCHRVGVYEVGSFEHARRTLQKIHSDRMVENTCTLLISGERFLRAFTADTASKHPDGFDSDLESVISVGNYLTNKWRNQMEQTWRVPVIDTFSLSEIFGNAVQSLVCGWYHFEPYVIPEVISPKTLCPISEGQGILVLTTLYPFQEAQPLIRYLTGDLVEVTHTVSSRPGELAIKPLGRSKFGVPLPDSDEWLLTPVSVLDVLDNLSQVARKPIFRDAYQVKDPELIGAPIYRLSWESNGNTVQIELLVALRKEVRNNIASKIEQQVLQELRQMNEPLAHYMDLGIVQFRVLFTTNLEDLNNALDIWM